MVRRRRYVGYLFPVPEYMPAHEQAQLWRAAAKGHLANGEMAKSKAAIEQARFIERVAGLRFTAKTNGRADQMERGAERSDQNGQA